MVSQPLGRRRSRLSFYIILIFVSITTVSWLRTTTTYVSVREYTFVRVISVTSFVPADVYSQHDVQASVFPLRLVYRPTLCYFVVYGINFAWFSQNFAFLQFFPIQGLDTRRVCLHKQCTREALCFSNRRYRFSAPDMVQPPCSLYHL
ncbi:hypothetical protein ARMGADRAFT_350323 [Armillaria gallica]|uniref:Uncharacterized protein n=1 Tax=Armillaria gallica TaxID=47427 RepID=A0A2H3D176_ARMGA|nr:hypothetical protein ARMGADRAFT_350323 [Armillaria gallica]